MASSFRVSTALLVCVAPQTLQVCAAYLRANLGHGIRVRAIAFTTLRRADRAGAPRGEAARFFCVSRRVCAQRLADTIARRSRAGKARSALVGPVGPGAGTSGGTCDRSLRVRPAARRWLI